MFLDCMASNPSAFLEFPKFPNPHGPWKFKIQLQTISSHPSRSSWHPGEIADLPGTPQRLRWWWFKRSCQPLAPCTDFHWNSKSMINFFRFSGLSLGKCCSSWAQAIGTGVCWNLNCSLIQSAIFVHENLGAISISHCKLGHAEDMAPANLAAASAAFAVVNPGTVAAVAMLGFQHWGEMAAGWWAVSSFHLGRHVVELLVQLVLKVHVIQSHSCVS